MPLPTITYDKNVITTETLDRNKEWSGNTFGWSARVIGITEHIRSELQEVIDSNGALSEWVDVIILGFDGAWRSGATSQEILNALEAKYQKNFKRVWPRPDDESPSFHMKGIED